MNGQTAQKHDLQKLMHQLTFYPHKRLEIFRSLPVEEWPVVIRSLGKQTRRKLVTRLSNEELARLIEGVDPDEAADLLQMLDKKRHEKVLLLVSEELKAAVSTLLQFEANTAAGLMTLDFIQVDESDTVDEVAERFRVHEKRTGRLPVIVVMKGGQLAGHLPVHELAMATRSEKVGKYTKRMLTIRDAAKHGDVVQLFRSHPHSKVAVRNEFGSVIGIIYSDDVLQILHEQGTASLYRLAGVHDEETVGDSAEHKVQHRYKWLILNLATGFLVALTVGQFEDVLSKYVLLAVYMPIVAGMGGNAATQTLAVMVRGIALRQITLRNSLRALKSELGSGLVNGMINGVLVALVVLVVNRDLNIAFILAMAMVANLLVAGFFGTLVPLIMARLGKDPAASATVFITTATDVLGFLVFLGLAAMILP